MSTALTRVLCVLAALGAAAAALPAEDFETPPALAPAALVPADLASGENFRLQDPVPSDGLMHQFVIDSRFGRFDAYGAAALAIRVREIAALTQLAKTSDVKIVADSVGRGLSSQVETATTVALHPIKTVTGIPKGIGHLFHGYVNQGKELLDQAGDKPAGGGGHEGNAVAKGGDAARRYAVRYLGVTASERRWYEQLGVDPYTGNAVLRDAVHRKARVEAAAGFGLRFAGLPGIPEIGEVRRALDAIYKEDPATLRARDRATLAGLGLTPEEIARWQNSLVLSPTRQALMMEDLRSLGDVGGRAELIRHALELTSEVEAQVYLQSLGLLIEAQRQAPLADILPGVRLPAARLTDGSIIVCGAFDAVYWTRMVAEGEAELARALPQRAGPARLLWLRGRVSERARAELGRRGWEVHDDAPAAAPALLDLGSK